MWLRRVRRSLLVNMRWSLRGGPFLALLDDNFPGSFDSLKCVFIHIPKTAGSSVALSLFGYQTGHRKYVDYWRENRRKTSEYFKFAFVRNPWDRLISAYHFLCAGGMGPRDAAWAQREISPFATFEDFVKGWVDEQNIRRKNHFEPQYTYLVGYGSEDIKADFVGRVEYFAQDFHKICERLGVCRTPLHTNRSSRKDYRFYYTSETIDIVRRVYERDIALFGYDFDSPSSSVQGEGRAPDLPSTEENSFGNEAA